MCSRFVRAIAALTRQTSWKWAEYIGGMVRDTLPSSTPLTTPRGIYKGMGELYLSATQADAPTVRRFAELAAQQQLFSHAHVDDDIAEAVLAFAGEIYQSIALRTSHMPAQECIKL